MQHPLSPLFSSFFVQEPLFTLYFQPLQFPQPPFTLFNSTAAARIHLSPVVPEVDRDAVAQREEWGSKQDRRMQGAQETGSGDRDATSFARRVNPGHPFVPAARLCPAIMAGSIEPP